MEARNASFTARWRKRRIRIAGSSICATSRSAISTIARCRSCAITRCCSTRAMNMRRSMPSSRWSRATRGPNRRSRCRSKTAIRSSTAIRPRRRRWRWHARASTSSSRGRRERENRRRSPTSSPTSLPRASASSSCAKNGRPSMSSIIACTRPACRSCAASFTTRRTTRRNSSSISRRPTKRFSARRRIRRPRRRRSAIACSTASRESWPRSSASTRPCARRRRQPGCRWFGCSNAPSKFAPMLRNWRGARVSNCRRFSFGTQAAMGCCGCASISKRRNRTASSPIIRCGACTAASANSSGRWRRSPKPCRRSQH